MMEAVEQQRTEWLGVDRAVVVMALLGVARMAAVGAVTVGLLALAKALGGAALLALVVVVLVAAVALGLGLVGLALRGGRERHRDDDAGG